MNREEIIQFLKSEPMKFTYSEIEQMMDEELEKDPSEMDTDFIDLCADVLCNAIDANKEKELNHHPKKNKRILFKMIKIAAVAAILIIALCIAVPVAARYIDNDTSDKIVKFYEDHFLINLKYGKTDADKHSDENNNIVTKLKKGGFDDIILPSMLLEDNYTYTVDITEEDDLICAQVNFSNIESGKLIRADITNYKMGIDIVFSDYKQLSNQFDSAKQLSLNGMDILIFGNKESSVIIYADKDTEYIIVLSNNGFNSAVEIAESIEEGV